MDPSNPITFKIGLKTTVIKKMHRRTDNIIDGSFENNQLSITASCGLYIVGHLAARFFKRKDFETIFRPDTKERDGCDRWATTVFDAKGHIRAEIKTSGKNNSRVWGDELEQGNMAYIDCVWVAENYRNRKIASRLIEELQDCGTKLMGDLSFIFLRPDHVSHPISWVLLAGGQKDPDWSENHIRNDSDVDDASNRQRFRGCRINEEADIEKISREGRMRAMKFWRAKGARRLGMTDFFCIALDKNHPSHKLSAADDPDPLVQQFGYICKNPNQIHLRENCERLRLAHEKSLFPIKSALISMNDQETVQFLKSHLIQFGALAMSKELVTIPHDGYGTVLHDCMCRKRPESVRWLVETFGDKVSEARNIEGLTALEFHHVVSERIGKRRENKDGDVPKVVLREAAAMLLALKGLPVT